MDSKASNLTLLGVTLAKRYVLEALLDSGGSSWIYRARDRHLGAAVALKVLSRKYATRAEIRARYEREARTCAALRHPNVIGVSDFGCHGDRPYLAMDLVEGETLARHIHREARLPPSRAISLLRQVCLGLAHAHGHGLVHRDLKPDNVMIGRDGKPRIVDFGLAIRSEAQRDDRVTAEGLIVGTPEYVSPEQACGLSLDDRSDIFSLGLILYEMLTGLLPFDGAPVEIARQNAIDHPPPPSARNPAARIPPALERLALRLLAKRPGLRPSASELARELAALASRSA